MNHVKDTYNSFISRSPLVVESTTKLGFFAMILSATRIFHLRNQISSEWILMNLCQCLHCLISQYCHWKTVLWVFVESVSRFNFVVKQNYDEKPPDYVLTRGLGRKSRMRDWESGSNFWLQWLGWDPRRKKTGQP